MSLPPGRISIMRFAVGTTADDINNNYTMKFTLSNGKVHEVKASWIDQKPYYSCEVFASEMGA